MNREHALRYLTALTAPHLSRLGHASTEEEVVEDRLLRAFLACFPASYEDEPVFDRLSRPVDAKRLASFEAVLTIPQRTILAKARRPMERVLTREVPRPDSAQALRCLDQLQRVARLDGGERERFAREFSELISAWGESVQPYTDDARCPDCDDGYLLELDATPHLRACPSHPAILQLEAVRVAARLNGATVPPELEALRLPADERSVYGQKYEAESALTRVLSARRGETDQAQEKAVKLLTRVGREWAHFVDRGTDPCPWCQAVVPFESFRAHLRACEQHPAALQLARLRAAASLPPGLEQLVRRRLEARHELERLSTASTTFDGDMGWTGDAAYSDKYSEAPWRAAIARARTFLALGERTRQRRPPAPSPVRAAMKRLLSKGEVSAADQRAAIQTVREAVATFDAWRAHLTFGAACPACRRRGLPRADLAAHLEACPLGPTGREVRAAAALELLRNGAELPRLELGQYDPDDYRDFLQDYLRRKRDEALAELFEFHASELTADEARDLADFVARWEELACVAASDGAPRAHSGPPRVEPENELEALALRLVSEADQCEVRLARLHEACDAFWNGMRDGEDGKSISNDRIEEMWGIARAEAKEVLAAIPERIQA